MKVVITSFFMVWLLSLQSSQAEIAIITQKVFVETQLDTDHDGKNDHIYLEVQRANSVEKLPSIITMSPYSLGGNNTTSHQVDVDYLPQDTQKVIKSFKNTDTSKSKKLKIFNNKSNYKNYNNITVHSLGTGYSSGCPSVGDMSEALAGKAVIDWLNGRVRGFDSRGDLVTAMEWSNGSVGMIGVSYNGTLPTMIASTGVQGLDAIVPIAAIVNWYDYYRANGLVVGPGGYIGEDADELGYYIVKKNTCQKQLAFLSSQIGRDHGDFSEFWRLRNYTHLVKNIKAATFIIHGQNDWNVKQTHAINLWKALELADLAPRKMYLHSGGHIYPTSNNTVNKVQQWFDFHLRGKASSIMSEPRIQVQMNNKKIISQNYWPSENTTQKLFYFNESKLTSSPRSQSSIITIFDNGREQKISSLLKNPDKKIANRAIFTTDRFKRDVVLSGSGQVALKLKLLNRNAANLTVAIVEYPRFGRPKIITRGWSDPQNHADISSGEILVINKEYRVNFDLVPRQYIISKGSRLGVMIASTDFNYTLRPLIGTKIQFILDRDSHIIMNLD